MYSIKFSYTYGYGLALNKYLTHLFPNNFFSEIECSFHRSCTCNKFSWNTTKWVYNRVKPKFLFFINIEHVVAVNSTNRLVTAVHCCLSVWTECIVLSKILIAGQLNQHATAVQQVTHWVTLCFD